VPVAHIYNPSYLGDLRLLGSRFEGNLSKQLVRPPSPKQPEQKWTGCVSSGRVPAVLGLRRHFFIFGWNKHQKDVSST
jgi:hypothetical protein